MTRFKIKVLVLFLLVFAGMNAQIGVGTKIPNPDAMLEVSATNKGLLLPRIALSSTTSASPLNNLIAGMAVYNTATTGDVTPGYYYCDGVKWIKINAASTPDASTTVMGKIQLAGDLAGTAALPTVPGLAMKVDKVSGKGLSTEDFTTSEKTKLGAITGTNTGDQDLSGYATVTALDAKVVDAITDAVTISSPTQNAVFDALALKANKVEVTSVEIMLPTKINSKQLYSKSGTLSIGSGTAATITEVSGLTDYYSIRILKDGKPFRNEVRSFSVVAGSPIAVITGNGMMSEIYPSGTYTYVLEYFKN